MSDKTASETLFERFCDDNQIEWKRIEASSVPGKKEPDYEIGVPTQCVVVEVKQFDPNEEEKMLETQLQERGYADMYGGEPGTKVRLKIQAGAKQLKARSAGKLPTLLVLYNNVSISNRGVDPYEIKTAMYGIEKIDLAVNAEANTISVTERGFGPKRKLTPTDNTSLSAISVLCGPDNELSLIVYHNVYAVNPLDLRSFQGCRIRHFTLQKKQSKGFQEWRELKVERTDPAD